MWSNDVGVGASLPRAASEQLPAVCVSIHDVAPATWAQCAQLLRAIRAVGEIPLTWLVVPDYHHRAPTLRSLQPRFEAGLAQRLAAGDELALHGWCHLDEGAPSSSWRQYLLRHVYTTHEGEFSALDAAEASRRIAVGLAWFGRRQWPASGFVAPAWLLGSGAWQALDGFDFGYTTTLRYFYLLPERHALYAPSLVYAARNRPGRYLSRQRNRWLLHALAARPLLRFGLHPADAAYPALLLDLQRLLGQILETRTPMTKAAFAASWRTATRTLTLVPTAGDGGSGLPAVGH